MLVAFFTFAAFLSSLFGALHLPAVNIPIEPMKPAVTIPSSR